MNKKILVVIPARSKSKSIKNKNIRIVKNKPLLYYSIKYALKSKIVSKIIVSTDSLKYCNIAKQYGAEAPFLRPKKFAQDKSRDFEVINHALRKAEVLYNMKFSYVVLLRPTSPFRAKNLIEQSIKLLEENKKSTSVRSVIKTNYHPFRHWVKKNKYIYSPFKNLIEPYNIPRQELPMYYFQTGEIETIKRSTIFNGSISGKFVLPIIIRNYSIDIDSYSDLKNASK